ncbi:MAG TPA: hypothetical protein IAC14_07915 [Candidatus Scybalomonas excrementigallinarum]|nr:hypothetical protein [Candidatus Scybalomonas excrementigallinarum]
MNKIVEKAMELAEEIYKEDIKDLEIGDIVKLGAVWNGDYENPLEDEEYCSWSYPINDMDYINYVFEPIEPWEGKKGVELLDTLVRITNIELL